MFQLRLQVAFALGLLLLDPALATAAGKGSKGPRYFYAILQDGAAYEWNYNIPECAPLAEKEYRKLRRGCKTAGDKAYRCPTEKTVTLQHAAPTSKSPGATPVAEVMKEAQKVDDTTKTFKLDYIVHITKSDCASARKQTLTGD